MPAGGLATAAIIGGGIQAATGLFQQIKAGSLRKKANKRLEDDPFTIPSAATEQVRLAGTQAQGRRLPGQDQIEDRLASGTARTITNARQAATSPSQVLAATLQASQQQQEQQQNIDIQAAGDFQNRQQAFANAVGTLAPYQVEKWKYSTLYPAQADFNAASAFSGAGQQNVATGLGAAGSALAIQDYQNRLVKPG
jgi:hypothetical protein